MKENNAARVLGFRLRQERMRRDWSQEGLCRGICAVSWLSKLEQGKADASPEVLSMLLERLELPPYDDDPALGAAIEAQYERVFSGERDWDAFTPLLGRLQSSPWAADALVLDALRRRDASDLDPAWVDCFDARQRAMYLLLKGKDMAAAELLPNAFFRMQVGIDAYERGAYYDALPALEQAYRSAAEEGRPRLMLQAKLFSGNCYCNLLKFEQMERHYAVARRLAQTLGAARDLAAMEYNEASSWVECGDYARAEKFFAAFEQPGVMELHKLAICREKLGDPAGALAALDRAAGMQSDYPPTELSERMLALVRLRVEHPDYLRSEAYGRLLLESFARFRKELPSGYALFHRPWVLEWLLAHRQYKEAYALLAEDNR